MNNNCGIYCFCNLINGRKYIGKSINIKNRKSQHLNELRRGTHHSHYFQNTFNKYGEESFLFGVIEFCNNEELDSKERYYINLYDTYNNGFNEQIPTGENCGHLFTDADKAKHSIAMKLARSRDSKLSIERMRNGLHKGRLKSVQNKENRTILFYNPDTYEFIKSLNSITECCEFLSCNRKSFLKATSEIWNLISFSYHGYIILRPHLNQTIEQYILKLSIYNEKVELNKITQKLQIIYNHIVCNRDRLNYLEYNRDSRVASWKLNLIKATEASREKKRSSGESAIDVYIKDTGEYVGRWLLMSDFALEKNLKLKHLYKVLSGDKKSYYGYLIKRVIN